MIGAPDTADRMRSPSPAYHGPNLALLANTVTPPGAKAKKKHEGKSQAAPTVR